MESTKQYIQAVAAPENFSRVFNTKLEYNITKNNNNNNNT